LESSSSETTGLIEKSRECKNDTNIIYLLTKFGGDPPLHGGMTKKSWEFFVFVCHDHELE